MPQTDHYAIDYPCLGPAISLSDFSAYATDVEAALATVNAQTVPLFNRDYVATFGVNPASASGVTSTITWNAPLTKNNPNGMWNAGAPTLFTLQSSGSFLVSLHVTGSGFATETSVRGAVLVNGVEQLWGKIGGPTSTTNQFWVAGTLVSVTAGSTITATILFTGTGNITPNFDIQICKISDL